MESQSPDSFDKEKQRFSRQPPRANEDNRRYPPNSSFNGSKSPYSPNEDQWRSDFRQIRSRPPPHPANGDNRNYSSDPSFDSPYGPDADYQRYDSRPARPAYAQRQSAPQATGAFFAGSYDFAIYGGSFQENKGDARTDIHYDYSRNSGFGNQYGDRYTDSANYGTNYNGPYSDNRSSQSTSYSATANFSRGSGRGNGRGNIYSMDARGRDGYGRGRSSGYMSAESADIRFHSPPAGIPQGQQQRGSKLFNEQSAHRATITERGQYDPNPLNQRFAPGSHNPEEEEEVRFEDDPSHYESEQMELSEPYPMDEDSPQQQSDHIAEPVPASSTSTRKSHNPFAKFMGGTRS